MDKIFSPIKGRIMKYIDYKGIKKEDFYEKTSITASNFKGSGAKSEMGGDKIVKILTVYSDLNPEWLLLGTGVMVKTKTPPDAVAKEGVNKDTRQKEFSSHIENPAFRLILQELHVVRELQAWTLVESCKISESVVVEKIRNMRSEFQEG